MNEKRTASDANPLLDFVHELGHAKTFESLLDLLAVRLPTLLPVSDRVSVVFRGNDPAWMRFYKLVPHRGASIAPGQVRIDGTPVGKTVTHGAPQVVSDVRADRKITFGHAAKGQIRSTASVPIVVRGAVVGALNMGSTHPGACTEAMVPALRDVAAVLGPAILALEPASNIAAPDAPSSSADSAHPRAADRDLGLLGAHPSFLHLVERARRAAQSDAHVLITGETGVGKSALARAIHNWSPRRDAHFVTVHLGSLSPTVVESEMFGHERGAFTGAVERRLGRFERAAGGTLFIDELGDTPPAVQAKVLRVVQDGTFERVGGNTVVETDTRIISATHHDLSEAVAAGRFREDLLYRLNVLPLHVPPLRERGDDIELLADAILGRLRAQTARPLTLSAAGRRRLMQHTWPGNVRELETALGRAAVLESSNQLDLDEVRPRTAPHASSDWPTLDAHQRLYVEQALAHTGGVIEGPRGAAKLLGLRPSTLRSKMKRHGIASSKGNAQ